MCCSVPFQHLWMYKMYSVYKPKGNKNASEQPIIKLLSHLYILKGEYKQKNYDRDLHALTL